MEVEARERLEKAELETILESGIFAKSPNLAKLLTYICEKYWEGKTDQVKEYNLAVEALGRPPDFNPAESAIVRVEAHRLREKLKKYYEGEGASHSLIIALQPGRYVPRFVDVQESITVVPSGAALSAMAGQESSLVSVENEEAAGLTRKNGSLPANAAGGVTERTLPGRSLLIAGFAVTAVIILGVIGVLRLQREKTLAPEVSVKAPVPVISPIASAAPLSQVRIIAGYSRKDYVDRAGETWSGDAYFTSGGVSQNPGRFIFRTLDPTLFETYRHGEFSYDIPLKSGTYELWLYFVETMYGPGTILGGGETSRIFDVQVNGRTVLSQFDIFADAGGNFIADERVFKDIRPASDGFLHVKFLRRKEEPLVNAIKVIPTVAGKLQPIRIVAQDDSYTDHNGAKWVPDRFFKDGQLVTRRQSVSGTPDAGLFSGERYGNFDYSIPVAEGKYTVRLYFSERYFGPNMAGGGGVGSRVFNVVCNGNTVLKDFDIFKEAGGAGKALVKTLHGITPNAQGKITLHFLPVVNYALVDAIEVTDEAK